VARARLVATLAPLSTAVELRRTLEVYLEGGGALEACARALFVHPNTVRYRLGRISDVTGYDLTSPREAWTVRIALALGRLALPPRPAGSGRAAVNHTTLEETSKVSPTTS
jgi:DNA-binding PucR family transcriptional regulator